MFSFQIEDDTVASEFGGGIPKRSLTYIEGENGTGKSVLSQRFMYGFCKNDHSVTYISPQFDTQNFVSQMRNLSYDIVDYLLTSKQLKFMPVNLDDKPVDVDDTILDTLENEKSYVFRSDVTIIDSLDMVLRTDPVYNSIDSDETRKNYISNFISFASSFAKNNDKSIIITTNPTNIQDDYAKLFRNHSDIYMKLGEKSIAGNKSNYIDVVRFLLSENQVSEEIMYDVQSGVGVSINSASFA